MTHKEYLRLLKLLRRYNYEYHTLSKTSVSDDVYDSLMLKVKEFETLHPGKISSSSPTQRVGASGARHLTKVKHQVKMPSLQDVFTQDEVKQWNERLEKWLDVKKWSYFIDIKMDGLALSVHYVDGKFQRAITRGDGKVGEDVTYNAKTISNLPLVLPATPKGLTRGELIIRGEVLLYSTEFERINREKQKQGKAPYANARNLASGSLRQLDVNVTAQRRLVFRAYDIVAQDFKTQEEVFKTLKKLQIAHNRQAKVCKDFVTLMKTLKSLSKIKDKLPFHSDGMVIRVNEKELYRQAGSTAKSPRAAIAYKYPARQATTKITKIALSIGRTGVITPVAELQPVRLDGTLVTHASLHNIDEIARLDVRSGDTVVVFKAGDIIPKIEKVLKDLRPASLRKFNFSKEIQLQHPGIEFERQEEEVAYKIIPKKSNKSSILLKLALKHYASRKALNIEGLGESTARDLVKCGLVSDLADIYKLSLENIQTLPRFADKSAQNLVQAVQNSKNPSLDKFLTGLGIESVGEQTALDLAEAFRDLPSLRTADKESLQDVKGIGQQTADSIFAWLQDTDKQKLLDKFIKLGVKVQPLESSASQILAASKIVVSGRFAGVSRKQLQDFIRQAGGHPTSQISSKTDYLLAGDKPGLSKLSKAKSLGVKIINYQQLQELLKQ